MANNILGVFAVVAIFFMMLVGLMDGSQKK